MPGAGASISFGRMPLLIAFDLDGVLYSTEPFLVEAYRDSIARVNRLRPGSFDRVPESGEIFQHIGWPVPTILARLFPHTNPQAVSLLYDVTLEVICAGVAERRGTLFARVPETLALLRDRGHALVVASNGRRRYIETVLETYELEPLFAPLLTVDSGSLPDKPALLRAYVDRHDAPVARVVMIGDRASDVEAAHAVGCRFIGCDYGHGHRDELEGQGPIVSAFADLPAAIEPK